ncbi:MAG: hypothetical protein IPK68_09765 [Bdellovibrionales bacterium]|nr:hypothetical protein [Bdellovibrionales bacterium]
MKDKRSVFIFGMHSNLLSRVIDSLSKHFENVNGTTSLKEVLLLVSSTPPDLIVIGGGVPSEMRLSIFEAIQKNGLATSVVVPNGPDDVLDAISRATRAIDKSFMKGKV